MNFIHPHILYFAPLVLAVLLILAFSAGRRRREKLKLLLGSAAGDPDAVRLSPRRRRIRVLLLFLVLAALLLAAARPFGSSRLLPGSPRGRDIVVLFDVSKSMLANDIAPSRLEHAKYLLRELAAAEPGDRFGLVAFAGNAYLTCPLTSDPVTFSQYIDELDVNTVPLGGTNLELALARAEQAFKAASGNNRAIILITDGDELTGSSRRLVSELKKRDIPIFVIGLGDPVAGAPVPDGEGGMRRDRDGNIVTTRLNEPLLRELATATGGIYVRTTVTDTGLEAIKRRIAALDAAEREEASQRMVPIENFPFALIAAAIFFVLYWLISERPAAAARIIIVSGMVMLAGSVQGADPAAPAPPAPLAEKLGSGEMVPELPGDPVELYNLARERQLAGDEEAARLYEEVIRNAVDRPELQARSLLNLGVDNHNGARARFNAANGQVQSQQLDEALKTLDSSLSELKNAEELYSRSLAMPEAAALSAESGSNLRQLELDRQQIEELKKKIEELKKQQQQAQQQTQQAQQQNQQDQQNQSQDQQQNQQNQQSQSQDQQQSQQDQSQDQQQNQQDQQNQSQDQQQSQQSQQDQQQNQQNQQNQSQDQQQSQQDQSQDQQQSQQDQSQDQQQNQSTEQKIEQARQSASELERQARELNQEQLAEQARQAQEELEKARQQRERNNPQEAQKHLDEAVKSLGGQSADFNRREEQQPQDQSGESGNQNDDSEENKGEEQQDQQQQPQGQQEEPGAQPLPEQPEKTEQPENDSAEQLLQMLNDEENLRRDELRRLPPGRRPRVEKDW